MSLTQIHDKSDRIIRSADKLFMSRESQYLNVFVCQYERDNFHELLIKILNCILSSNYSVSFNIGGNKELVRHIFNEVQNLNVQYDYHIVSNLLDTLTEILNDLAHDKIILDDDELEEIYILFVELMETIQNTIRNLNNIYLPNFEGEEIKFDISEFINNPHIDIDLDMLNDNDSEEIIFPIPEGIEIEVTISEFIKNPPINIDLDSLGDDDNED